MNINRSNKRKWLHTKKGKEHTISNRNYYWCRLCRQCTTSYKYVCSSWIKAAESINFYMNSDKSEFISLNQDGTISSLNGKTLRLVNQLIYLSSNISSTESNVKICISKIWTGINSLLTIWKSDLSDKIKWEFFQAVAISVQLYGCTIGALTKHLEKKLDENYTRMLHAVLNKFWMQHPTKQQ